MDRLRKSFRSSFRRKKDHIPESIKPHQWQSDEMGVKSGNCMFPVKYLGCVEVFESRGMQICEDALRRLRVINFDVSVVIMFSLLFFFVRILEEDIPKVHYMLQVMDFEWSTMKLK